MTTDKRPATSNPGLTMRNEEEYARHVFDEFVRARSGGTPQWASDHQDPPDFWLSLGGERIAVEVTLLFNRFEVMWSGTSEEKPSPAIKAKGMHLIKEIEREALSAGILKGEYFVSFPELSIDWHSDGDQDKEYKKPKRRSEIKRLALEFIKATKEISNFEITSLDFGLSIFKRSGTDQRVAYAGGFGDSAWSGNPLQRSTELIEEILKVKSDRMRQLNEAKVLLIVDQYLLRTDYSDFSTDSDFLGDFDTVVLISPFGDYPWILHTVREEWQ